MCSWARVNPSFDVSNGPSTVLTLAIVSYPLSVRRSLAGARFESVEALV